MAKRDPKAFSIPSPGGLPSSKVQQPAEEATAFVEAANTRSLPAPVAERASGIQELGTADVEERATRGLTVRFTQRELDLLGMVAKRQERSKHFVARRYVTEALEADVSDRAHLLGLIQLQHPEKTKPALMAEAIDYLFEKYGTPGNRRTG